MQKHFHLIFITLLFAFLLASCGIQKRLYRNGFYFGEGKGIVHSPQQKTTIANPQPIVKQKETGTARVEKSLSPEKVISQKFYRPEKLRSAKTSLVAPEKKTKLPLANFPVRKQKIISSNKKAIDEIDFEEERKIKSKSITALVFSILAFPGTVLFFVGGIAFAIVAITSANDALKRAKNYPLPVKATDMARAGKIIAIVYLCLVALLIILFLLVLTAFAGII